MLLHSFIAQVSKNYLARHHSWLYPVNNLLTPVLPSQLNLIVFCPSLCKVLKNNIIHQSFNSKCTYLDKYWYQSTTVITSILKQPHLQLLQVQLLVYWWHHSCSVSPPRPASPRSNNPAPPSAPVGTFGCSPQWHILSLEPGPQHWKMTSPAETGIGERRAPQHHATSAARVLGVHMSSSAASLSETEAASELSSWLQKMVLKTK